VAAIPWAWGALALCATLLVATTRVPGAAVVLEIEPPDASGWLLILGFSLVPWLVGQLFLERRRVFPPRG
jgi:Ca2+-transporting ATPase